MAAVAAFLIGYVVGGVFGVAIICLMVAAGRSDDENWTNSENKENPANTGNGSKDL